MTLSARAIKTSEEIALLDHAAGIVDAVYDQIYRSLRPGVTEQQIVADAQKMLFDLGSEQVEAINAVSGDRCKPHPRLQRPAEPTRHSSTPTSSAANGSTWRSTWSAPAPPPTRSPPSGRPPRSSASPIVRARRGPGLDTEDVAV
ncbi:MAG TPA: hypothetical protein VFJ57_11225 [Solirubrobacterales bacterium]|nr:hypothetical protein [Solirubrobacterales bacterium]